MAEARTVVGDRRPMSRGDRQRNRIIEAVVELLGTVPIADLSVMRVAEHAGVTRPAFYFYFESKYAVVAAALEEVWIELDSATADLADFDFTEPAAVFSERMIANAVTVWQQRAALLGACLQARESDPQLKEMWDRFLGNLVDKLAGFIDTLRSTGQVRPASTDTPALAHALVGMTIWALHEQQAQSSPVSPERLMGAVRAVWLAAAWGATD